MGIRIPYRVLLGTLALVLLLSAAAISSEEQAFSAMRVLRIDPPVAAPDLVIPKLEGGELRLADYRGKVIIVGFFVTTCPNCRREAPAREALYQQFKARGLEMLAINLNEEPQDVLAFQKQFGLTSPVLLDRDSRFQKLLGVRGYPSTVLIDRKGRIVGEILGERDWQSEAARRLVGFLLQPSK